jgi:hypothetical protein
MCEIDSGLFSKNFAFPLDFFKTLWYSVVLTGGDRMAQITIEELYHGEKYNIMGNALAELMTEGKETNDTRTALELMLVKHTVLAVKKTQANGDTIKI